MDKLNLTFSVYYPLSQKTYKVRGYETKHFFVDENARRWRKDSKNEKGHYVLWTSGGEKIELREVQNA